MTPGDEEQWTLSVQHTEADIDRYVDAFTDLCGALTYEPLGREPDERERQAWPTRRRGGERGWTSPWGRARRARTPSLANEAPRRRAGVDEPLGARARRARRQAWPTRRRGGEQGVDVSPDDVDKALIEVLQRDGRTPYTKLGVEVGLSEAAVRQRVQRLVDTNVVQIVAVTDPLRLGFRRQAMIGVRTTGDITEVAACARRDHRDRLRGVHVGQLRPARGDGVRGRRSSPHLDERDPTHARRARVPRPSCICASRSRPTAGGQVDMTTIGVPRELKPDEHRIAITPTA